LLSFDDFDAAKSPPSERAMPQKRPLPEWGCRKIAPFQNGDAAKWGLGEASMTHRRVYVIPLVKPGAEGS